MRKFNNEIEDVAQFENIFRSIFEDTIPNTDSKQIVFNIYMQTN